MRLRHWVANRVILRPSRHAIEAAGLGRCALPCTDGTLECFAARQDPARHDPARHDPARQDRAPQAITIPSAEPFDWESAEPLDLLVLKLAGTGGRAERSTLFPASLLGDQTAEVWTCNPPGYGRSSGRATLASIAAASLAFCDWVVARRRAPGTRVWVCGNSLGCATGLHLAAAREIDGLVLRNPPPLIDLVRLHSGWWNLLRGGDWVASGIPHEMDAVATASSVLAPIVFIQSDADKLVPPALQQHVRDAHPGPQRTVRLFNAAHDTPITEADSALIADAVQWLWEATAPSPIPANKSGRG